MDNKLQQELMEFRIRALHDMFPDALSTPHFGPQYSQFVRTVRERLHPRGKKDIRDVRFDSGPTLKVNCGDRLGCDIYYGYIQDLFDLRLFYELLNQGAVVFDVGANFGLHSIFAGMRIGPSGIVYSFEPDQNAYQLLKENVRLNKLEKVVLCHPVCISETDGKTDYYMCEESSFSGMGHTERSKLQKKIKVATRSIDSIVLERELTKIDAIKVDVEGFEYAVLNGALGTIQQSDDIVIMMEVSKKNLDDQKCDNLCNSIKKLYELGLHGWGHDPKAGKLLLFQTPEEIVSLESSNVLFVYAGAGRESLLHKIYKNLLLSILDFTREVKFSDDLAFNKKQTDPYNYNDLFNSILYKVIGDFNRDIESLKEQLTHLQYKNKEHLKLIQNKEEEVTVLKKQIKDIQKENVRWREEAESWKQEAARWKKDGEYWKQETEQWKKDGEYWKQETEQWKKEGEYWKQETGQWRQKFEFTKVQYIKTEEDSKKRLELIHKKNAEVEYWKQEANLSVLKFVEKKIRKLIIKNSGNDS